VRWSLVLIVLAFAAIAGVLRAKSPAVSTSLPMAKPGDEGFSADRLQKVHDAMQRHIDTGEISGAVTLSSRNGRVIYFDAQELADIPSKRPMQKDEVFELACGRRREG